MTHTPAHTHTAQVVVVAKQAQSGQPQRPSTCSCYRPIAHRQSLSTSTAWTGTGFARRRVAFVLQQRLPPIFRSLGACPKLVPKLGQRTSSRCEYALLPRVRRLIRFGNLTRVKAEESEHPFIDVAPQEQADEEQEQWAERRVVVVRPAAEQRQLRLGLVQAVEGGRRGCVAGPLPSPIDVMRALQTWRTGAVTRGREA